MQEQLIAAIDTFYDCIGDRFDLERSAGALSRAANDTGILFSHNFPMRGGSDSLIHHNFPEGAIDTLLERQYDTQAHEMFKHIDSFPEHTHVLRQSYLEDNKHHKTRIYQEVLRPWGMHSEGLSIVKKKGLDSLSCWSIRHPEQSEIDATILTQLTILIKQLARAMEVQRRMDTLEQRLSRSDNALDILDFGLVLYDKSSKLCFANRKANAIFDEDDGIRLGRKGLEFSARGLDRKFQEALSQRLAPVVPYAARIGEFLKINRPSGNPPLSVAVLPIVGASKLDLHTTSVAVMIFDPLERSHANHRMLQTTFAFTKAEAALAVELTQGVSAEQYASARGVSISAVRTQLRSLFSKTETTRQGELISLILRSYTGITFRQNNGKKIIKTHVSHLNE